MKISWNSFAQRRNLNLQMFNNMTYKEYSAWCNERRVTPVSLEMFDKENKVPPKMEPVVPTTPQEVTTVSTHFFNHAQLKKLKKSALIVLCKEQNIDLSGNETKNNLIRLLLSMNK